MELGRFQEAEQVLLEAQLVLERALPDGDDGRRSAPLMLRVLRERWSQSGRDAAPAQQEEDR
jgi:hypothetical protein